MACRISIKMCSFELGYGFRMVNRVKERRGEDSMMHGLVSGIYLLKG